jgi:prephenate dehydrogenase
MKLGFSITIVGLGLIGGSYAMALKKNKNITLYGIDKDENIIKQAKSLEIVKKASSIPQEFLGKSDVVIICLYPKLTIEFVKNNMEYFKKNSIITDVSGIKTEIVHSIQSFLRDDLEFLGGHPMSGSEYSGLVAARADLFEGNNYLLTPTKKNTEYAIAKITALVKDIGSKLPKCVDPELHDKMVAHTSQLTHVIASSLVNSSETNVTAFTGNSYRELTRIALINTRLWSELMLDNKDLLIEEIDKFTEKMTLFRNFLKEGNTAEITDFFERGSKIKKGMI